MAFMQRTLTSGSLKSIWSAIHSFHFLSTDVLRLMFDVLQFQFLSFSVWNLSCPNKSRWNRDSNLTLNHEYIFSRSARKRHNNGPEYKSEQRCGGLSRPFVAVTYFVAGACSHQPCSSPTLSSSHICIFGLWILHVLYFCIWNTAYSLVKSKLALGSPSRLLVGLLGLTLQKIAPCTRKWLLTAPQ